MDLALKLRSLSKETLSWNTELSELLLWLGNSLLCTRNATKAKVLQRIAQSVYTGFFKAHTDDSKKVLLASSEKSLFAVIQLGHLLGELKGDSEIIESLSAQSNAIVFNDKHAYALTDIHYFSSFYNQINEEILLSKILPAAQLVCNRQESFVQSLVFVIDQLNFKLSIEAAKQLIPEMLSREALGKGDKNVSDLISTVSKNLAEGATREAFETEIVRNHLLNASAEANQDVTVDFMTRVLTIKASFDYLKAVGKDASESITNEIASAFLSLLISAEKDEAFTMAFDVIIDEFKKERLAQSDTVLAFLEQNASKLMSATQVNFIAASVCQTAPQAWKDSVSEAVKKILLAQNFTSAINYSFMLSLLGLLNKMGKLISIFNSEQKVSAWLADGQSVVTRISFFDKKPSLADVS